MTNIEILVTNNMPLFIKWAKINHGDHENCKVAEELELHEAGIATGKEVLDAVIETEGKDWEESFELFITENSIP